MFCANKKGIKAIAGVVMILPLGIATAEEITPFKLTGVEGHVEIRFREDSQDIDGSLEKRQSLEEEVFVLTHSYVYHPKFLKVDFGVGPLFRRDELDLSGLSRRDDSTEYNLTARLSFLEEKPYPFLLFYDRSHPSVSLNLTDRFVQDTQKYGLNFRLKKPLTPVGMTLEATRQETEGQGFDLRIKDTTDQVTFRADMEIAEDGYGRLTLTHTGLVSESGFLALPVQRTEVDTDSVSFDTRVFFGADNEYQFIGLFGYMDQGPVRPLRELRASPEFRWRHNKDLESYYRAGFLNSRQEELESTTINLAGGFRYDWAENLAVNGELKADSVDTTGLELTSYGASGQASYEKKLEYGLLSFSAGVNLNYFDRVVTQNVPVRDLIVNLVGTNTQFLPHENIVKTSIRVFRIFGGGTEVELTVGVDGVCDGTIDILITSIGTRSQIENCNGAIDGDIQVSVDYEYDPGGTVAYSEFTQNYQANLQLFNYYRIYARFRDTNASIRSGVPTIPLSESRNYLIGAAVDYPLNEWITAGAEGILETEDSTLTSFDRDTVDVYVQFAVLSGSLRLSGRSLKVDYEGTTEDVDLVRCGLQLRARPWYRVHMTLDLSDEEDVGRSLVRKRRNHSLNIEWRIRKLFLKVEARYVNDITGNSERDRRLLRLSVRRQF